MRRRVSEEHEDSDGERNRLAHAVNRLTPSRLPDMQLSQSDVDMDGEDEIQQETDELDADAAADLQGEEELGGDGDVDPDEDEPEVSQYLLAALTRH